MASSTLATAFYAVMVAMVLSTIVYMIAVTRLMSRLRDAHNDVYVRLGQPSLFWNNSPANSVRLTVFILRGQYVALADQNLNTLGRICRTLIVGHFAGFVFCSIVVAFYWTVLD